MEFGLANLWPFLFSALFFILLRLAYYNMGLLIFRHPLSAGIVLWLATGNFNLLLAAVFFELLWLDLFYVGTYVPPSGLMAYLLFAPLMLVLGLDSPPAICLPMLACLPFAAMSGKLESRLRLFESRNYRKMNDIIDAGGNIEKTASSIIIRSMLRLVMIGILLYSLAAMLLYGASILWIWNFGSIYSVSWATWGLLFSLAAIGGLLSLRIPWARVCFGACVLVAGGIYIF